MLDKSVAHGNKTIWIDVTTSYRWLSTPVGIVRTEVEIARYLLEKTFVKLCCWNGDGWLELSRADYEAKLSAISSTGTLLSKQRGNRLKSIAIKIAKLILVGPLRRFVPSLKMILNGCRSLQQEALYLLKRITSKLKDTTSGRNGQKSPLSVPFKKNDIYISMGLDWDDKNLDVIRQAKKEYGFKYVGVCYDLIPIFYPHFIVPGYREKLTSHFVNMVWNADLVMCISKFSQKQMRYFSEDICLRQIETDYFYLGSEMSTEKTLLQEPTSPGYCLYVSTIEPRKNHDLLYKAWDLLVQKHGKEKVPNLIFVGKRGWLVDNLLAQIENNPNTRDKISIQEHISDSELARLYQASLFTLFPSYVEGWGLPIAESLHYGKVCLHSDTSSMPEASQNLSISKSPYDVLGWVEMIEQLTFSPQFRQDIESRIRSDFSPVRWSETAEKFYRSLRKL